jgi:glycogen debranching enzyme
MMPASPEETAVARTHPGPAEIIQHEDQYYIRSTSALADTRTLVLKHGDAFAVFDRYGDVQPLGRGEQGLYHDGTRHLSRLSLSIAGDRPLLLSSTVLLDNSVISVDLTNPDLVVNGRVAVPRGTLHLVRSKLLRDAVLHERFIVTSYAEAPVEVVLRIEVDGDFADVFEVRGTSRARTGRRLKPAVGADGLSLGYLGLDGGRRVLTVRADPSPDALTPSSLSFTLKLEPHQQQTLELAFNCSDEPTPRVPGWRHAQGEAMTALERATAPDCRIVTSNEQFNDWLNRSLADLHMMTSETPHGLYPYAGVPWFSTPFGRDGIITALEALWVKPDLALGVLRFLAATQATESDPERDAEPGKILHEMRRGEMAALGEVPFGRYYGSVDSTPLFALLAGRYFRATGDRSVVQELWPHVEAALGWLENHGDLDGDGLLEYARQGASGLLHQGWKDSSDPVFHADGTLADPPIAICEMQGYAFAALRNGARLAAALGYEDRARALRRRAEALRHRVEEAFWDEELGTYVIALDGGKRPCRIRASNAGHLLFAGLPSPARARRVAHQLLSEDSFSGWGIRTVAAGETRYNPMSYHNGSIWPHDNAIIAAGLGRYGHRDEAVRIMSGLFDASIFMELHRLPELFCGFERRPGEGPTLYPLACAPQAWAAAAPFIMLQACLGMAVEAPEARLTFNHPQLPPYLAEVELRGLRVGDAQLDLTIHRHPEDVGVSVLGRRGRVEVVVVR